VQTAVTPSQIPGISVGEPDEVLCQPTSRPGCRTFTRLMNSSLGSYWRRTSTLCPERAAFVGYAIDPIVQIGWLAVRSCAMTRLCNEC
jgi:hypothetical protein